MKRLTDKRLALPPGVWQEVTREQRIELQAIPVPSKQDLYYRLCQIEDILCDDADEYDLDRLDVMCNQRMSMRDEVSERFSLTAKIPLDRLRELVEAERDGRCVVLPCKLHDKIFYIEDNCIRETEVESFHNWTSGRWKVSTHTDRMYDRWKGYEIDFSGIGEIAFLTRAEAESALKVREQT